MSKKTIPMEDHEKHSSPSESELQDEQSALTEVQDDELRQSIVSELSLSDDYDSDLVEKLMVREKENRKKLSSAIGQKIKYRDLANTQSKAQSAIAPDTIKQIEAQIQERFNDEYLADLDYSDELKGEIRKLAQYEGVTARAATQNSYIAHLISEEQKKRTQNEAAIGGSSARPGENASGQIPAEFTDPSKMINPEVRARFEEWKKNNR